MKTSDWIAACATVVSAAAVIAAITIALAGWKRDTALRQENHEREEERRRQDHTDAQHAAQARELGRLLDLWMIRASRSLIDDFYEVSSLSSQMRTIMLTLPGHLATILRVDSDLFWTTVGVEPDEGTRARLREHERTEDVGYKWLIFQRASAAEGRSFARSPTRPEWVEAEIMYDIAGLTGGDQDAVLKALNTDPRSAHN